MFNLEHAISEWRARMTEGGVKDAAILDELETHLREEIQEISAAGNSRIEAFEFAVARMGNPKSLRTEFNKISGATSLPSLPVIIGTALWVGLILFLALSTGGSISFGRLGFLLYTHIVTLTAGYLAAFLTGAFALYFLCLQWRGKLIPLERTSLDRAIVRFNRLSFGLIVAGFILGTIWALQNPGAQWTGRARTREWAAVIVALWQLMTWAMRFSHRKNAFRMMIYACGNVVAALGWFGPVFLEANSTAHFFMNFWQLQIFIGFHLLVVALAFARRFEIAKA